MNFNAETLETVARLLQEKHGFATTSQLDRAVAEIVKKTVERETKGNQFSISRMIRGIRIVRGLPAIENIDGRPIPNTAEADLQYVRALTTGATPGSYMVPTIQAEEIIAYLTIGGIARSGGVRIWPLNGIQKLTVPTATATPSWVWMAQNSTQTPTDPNLGQMAFDLKERRALVAVPNQLIAVSVPAFDTMLSEIIGLGAAEHEDTALFNTTTVSGGPTALYAAAGISIIHVGGSANGGNLAYSDLTGVLAKAAAVKAKGPFVWFMSPRTFYSRVLGMVDGQSRPLVLPTLMQGLQKPEIPVGGNLPCYQLFGYPVFVTPMLLENESVGSGTNQAHLVFANAKYIHIAQDGNIEFAVSLERFFDANETAIRAIQHEDFGYAPPAGIVVLDGIN